ncbi:MAG: hypothetical protein M1484_03030 [Patescibacteria group bacterium]|nr:hypothetical protein [Patescibacteria group bacterium]MCL5432046.1 hypothetical protein [Patescibacteria group bacterium]
MPLEPTSEKKAELNSANREVHKFMTERSQKDANAMKSFATERRFLPGTPQYEAQEQERKGRHDALSAKIRADNYALELLRTGKKLDAEGVKTIEGKVQEVREEIRQLQEQVANHPARGWAEQIKGKPAEAKVVTKGKQLEAELAQQVGFAMKLTNPDFMRDDDPNKAKLVAFLNARHIPREQVQRLSDLLRYHELTGEVATKTAGIERTAKNFATVQEFASANQPKETGAPAQKEAAPKLTPEVTAAFKNYIYQGGELIKAGRYAEAMQYFKNAGELAKVGRHISPARERMVNAIPQPGEYAELANSVAKNSWNKEGGRIELSDIGYYATGPDGRPQKQVMPPGLQQEIALVYMEEWLHSLQDIQGKPLAGQPDHEIDVAAYMEKNGIPMTDTFTRRYGRAEALARAKQTKG